MNIMETKKSLPACAEDEAPPERGVLQAFFEQRGTAEELGGNAPFLVEDPRCIWMVTRGLVDIFFIRVEQREPVGARYHCASIRPGEIFFVPVVSEGVGLLAVSAGASLIRRVDLAEFLDLAEEPERRAELAQRLDVWIAGLAEGAVSDEIRFTDLEVAAGIEKVIDGDLSVRTRGEVVWVELPADRGVYMDRRILGLDPDPVWIPLSGRAWIWIQTTESFTLRAISTEELLALPNFRHWLREFYTVFFACARQRVIVLDAEERERLKRLEENNRWAKQEAVGRLGQLLTGGFETAGPKKSRNDLHAACSMVGRALGITIRDLPGETSEDMDVAVRVARIAKASSVRVRKVLLEGKWWKRDHGPLLAFRTEGLRPVALLPASPSRYLLHDPGRSGAAEVDASLAASLDYTAYVFYRSLPDQASRARELLTFALRGSGRDALAILLIGALGSLLGLLSPMLTGLIFDTVIPRAERVLLFQIAIGLGAVAVGSISFEVTKSLALLRISTKANQSLLCGVWDRLLKLPVSFFRSFSAGDLVMRAVGFSEISAMVKGPATIAVLSALFTSFNLILMFYYASKLALIGLGLIALAVLFVWLVCRSLFGSVRRVYRLKGELSGMVFQLMAGIGKLRSAGAETRAFARWAAVFSEQMRAQYSGRLTGITEAVFSTVYPGLCTLVLFLTLGVFLKGEAPLSIGGFLAFNSAFGGFLTAVLSMSTALVSLVAVFLIHERAVPILEAPPEVDEARLFPGRLNGRIEVNQVSFRYDKEGPFILDNVSLQVEPGEFAAVVGPSGSGKSTLLRLLLGFEAPELGSIYYDGQELSRLDCQSVRRQMGVVLQNGSILPGSIFQNIIGESALSMDDAWRAARLAGIEQDIREMPMQMHTMIMEGAGGFSGGQKQRLMIARAVAANPRILFFDEATSALDNQTQDSVSRSIASLNATRVVIAHRLSTIVQADRIHVMAKGKVIQSGTYQELIARDGPFKELVARQIL